MNKNYQYLLIVIFYCFFAFYKMYPAISSDSESFIISKHSDPVGTIGWMKAFEEDVKEDGAKVIFNDKANDCKNVGFGTKKSGPANFIWMSKVWVFLQFFNPKLTYEMITLFSFILAGFFGFLLFVELNVSIWPAFLISLAFPTMEVFTSRAQIHLQLCLFFMNIISTIFVIRAIKYNNLKSYLFACIFTVLTFPFNEYNAYFGFIFNAVIFLSYVLVFRRKIFFEKSFYMTMFYCLITTFFLLSIIYPHDFFWRIISKFSNNSKETKIFFERNYSDFVTYSLKDFFSLFKTKLTLANHNFDSNAIYSIGLALPTISIILLGYISLKNKLNENKFIIPIIISSAIIILFTLSPEKIFSLINLTYAIAPMFRVSLRGLLFFDIGAILIFAILINYFYKETIKRKILVSFFSILVVFEMSQGLLFKQYPLTQLPDATAYATIKDKANGLLVEIPVLTEFNEETQLYIQLYNRIAHNKPIFNPIQPRSLQDPNLSPVFIFFANEINRADKNAINTMCDLNAKYIAINKLAFQNTETFKQACFGDCKITFEDKNTVIAELNCKSNYTLRKFFDEKEI